MAYHLYRLNSPRPTFPADMSSAEAAAMEAHVSYWQTLITTGDVVVYGPVADPAGAWGLAVVEAEAEGDVRAIGGRDPAVVEGVCTFDVFLMPATSVRS